MRKNGGKSKKNGKKNSNVALICFRIVERNMKYFIFFCFKLCLRILLLLNGTHVALNIYRKPMKI